MRSHCFLVLLSLAAAFPVAELNITNAEFQALSNSTLAQRVALATNTILPHLRIYFNQSSHAIEVTTTDASVSETVPDQQVDSSCSHKVIAEHPKGTGTLLHDSYLEFGVSNINWKGAQVFLDAKVDAQLDILADIKVETGAKVLHHCHKVAEKTVGVNVHSTGVNGLGVNFTASNAHIAKMPNSTEFALVFDFHADVVTLVLSWNVDQVTATGCKIKILGIDIASYCGLIENAIKNGVNKLSQTVARVNAPKIAAKLEAAINTKIGSTVTIPLKVLK